MSLLFRSRLFAAIGAVAVAFAAAPSCKEITSSTDISLIAANDMLLAADIDLSEASQASMAASGVGSCVTGMGDECESAVVNLQCGEHYGMMKFSASCDVTFSDEEGRVSRRYHGIPDHSRFIPCLAEGDTTTVALDFEHNSIEIGMDDDGNFTVKRCDPLEVRQGTGDDYVLYSDATCRTYTVPRADICTVTGHGDIAKGGKLYRINGIEGTEFCNIGAYSGCRNAPGYCVTDGGTYDTGAKGREGVIDTSDSSRGLNGWRASLDDCRWKRP